jgi:hypothetical protein
MRHTRKPAEPDYAYAFFPDDIDRAVSSDVKPLFLDGDPFLKGIEPDSP